MKGLSSRCLFLLLFLPLHSSAADNKPWFTGPFIAPPGITLPKGVSNFELFNYNYYFHNVYDRNWDLKPGPSFHDNQL